MKNSEKLAKFFEKPLKPDENGRNWIKSDEFGFEAITDERWQMVVDASRLVARTIIKNARVVK
jgi:hypothetical protein